MRSALIAAGIVLIASPALAFSQGSMSAPRVPYRFMGNPGVLRFAAEGAPVEVNTIRDQPTAAQQAAKRKIVEIAKKGKPDDRERIRWSDSNDNPFMAEPLKEKAEDKSAK